MSAQPRPDTGPTLASRLDDAGIMLLMREGEPEALDALMERYWEPLVRYAARLLGSVDRAEDAVQDVFLKVWDERARWEPAGTAQAFLYRVVRNRALQAVRRATVRERYAPEISRRRQPVPTPLDVAASGELEEALDAAIAGLPPRRREAFVLTRYHRLSLAEVAQVMNISPQTAANHVTMAVAALRRTLDRFLR